MPKYVRSAPARTAHSGTPHCLRNDHGDGSVAGEGPIGSTRTKKERVIIDRTSGITDVRDDRVTDFLSHRQQSLATALADNTDGALSPVKITEPKPENVAGAQPYAGEQQHNRAVSDTRRCAGAARTNDSLDVLGLQVSRQRRKTPVRERWNACVEPRRAQAICDEVAQERSHSRNTLFPSCPTSLLAYLLNELPQASGLELAHVISDYR